MSCPELYHKFQTINNITIFIYQQITKLIHFYGVSSFHCESLGIISWVVTLNNISAVLFSNILNTNDRKIIKLIFTALTPVFWSIYSIHWVKAYQGISLLSQLDMLTQVDPIQHAWADDKAELTVLRVVVRVWFVGEKHHSSNGRVPFWDTLFNNPRATGGKA